MKKLTKKDFNKFLSLKRSFEKKIENILRDEGKIKEDENVELEVDWLVYDCMAQVTIYNLADPNANSSPKMYYVKFNQLTDE